MKPMSLIPGVLLAACMGFLLWRLFTADDPFGDRARERDFIAARQRSCALRMSFAVTRADSLAVLDFTFMGRSTSQCADWLVADTLPEAP